MFACESCVTAIFRVPGKERTKKEMEWTWCGQKRQRKNRKAGGNNARNARRNVGVLLDYVARLMG